MSDQSQWGRRYQDEELRALRSELDTVSREVEAETKQLLDREEIIRSIRDEQQQVQQHLHTRENCGGGVCVHG